PFPRLPRDARWIVVFTECKNSFDALSTTIPAGQTKKKENSGCVLDWRFRETSGLAAGQEWRCMDPRSPGSRPIAFDALVRARAGVPRSFETTEGSYGNCNRVRATKSISTRVGTAQTAEPVVDGSRAFGHSSPAEQKAQRFVLRCDSRMACRRPATSEKRRQ